MRQRINGKCPACKCTGTLFVADGDYITCSLDKCPDPTLVASILNDDSYSIVLNSDVIQVCKQIEDLSFKIASMMVTPEILARALEGRHNG